MCRIRLLSLVYLINPLTVMSSKYSEIERSLLNKPRKEQYLILLHTEEWENFRKEILDTYANVCEKCHVQGQIEVEMSQDEKVKCKAEFEEQLKEFNQRKKHFSHEQWISSLLDGTYVGRPCEVTGMRLVGDAVLQIHHKLYFYNKLPWQYTKDRLEILCKNCHEEVHSTTHIYTYQDETMQLRKEEVACEKCSGTGYIPEYYHINLGICYDCGGLGLIDNGSHQWVPTS